ncbi:MAG: hypothetical protein WC222_05900 [Parachlamydiales bacterium]|jgi:hypothetical protein
MVSLAKESSQVERARKKIEKRLSEQSSHVTPDSIKESANVIRGMIERHQEERIPLHDKGIALFDANHSSATVKSRYVLKLMKELTTSGLMSKAPTLKKRGASLKGRIKVDTF